MLKSKLFATLTLVFAAVAILSTMSIARTAFAAGDDVFMDEGDGDFDSMPAPAPQDEAPAQQEDASVPKIAEPRPAAPAVEDSEEIPMLTDDSAAPAATPAPTEDSAQPEAAKPKKHTKKKTATKSASNDGGFKAAGQFVVTKDACPMMRSPASTGETMLTVKAAKKIWVEDAGDGWVRAFNKAGEPGYVSKDCVE
jgi:hypothetical protein